MRRAAFGKCVKEILCAHLTSVRQDSVLGCMFAGAGKFTVAQTFSGCKDGGPIDLGCIEKG